MTGSPVKHQLISQSVILQSPSFLLDITMKFPSTTTGTIAAHLLLQQAATIAAAGCDPTTPSLASLATFTDNLRDSAASSPSVDTITCPAPGGDGGVFDHSHKRVLLIGIDGLRADAAAMLPLPNLRRLSQLGTSTFWASVQTTEIAVSGPGWASLLTGHEPTDHLVNSNGQADMREIAEPTILKAVKDAFSDIKVAATVTWHPLINDFIDHQDPSTLDAKHLANSDEEATVQAEQWIQSGEYDFIFVDMDECDGAGHSYGFDGYANEYSEAVMEMDSRVGRLLDAVIQNSGDTEYLIVLTTDHGGQGQSHSAYNAYNRRIPFFVASNSNRVAIGTMPREDTGSQMDVFPTILHFLNAPIPDDLEGQVFGFQDYARATPPTPAPCVPDPSTCSCADDQSDYRGEIQTTESGKTCMRWDEQDPHSHTRTPSNYPNAGLENNNYCRNPDGEPRAWCYTTDSGQRWELCNVPQCGSTDSTSSPTSLSSPPTPTPTPPESTPPPSVINSPNCSCLDDQSDYRGEIQTTETGKTCMRWDEQDPHSHTRTPNNYPGFGLEDNNYCRNPDGEPRAWCYTTDPGQRWELCDVPACVTCNNGRLRSLRG